jgi:hypothetical protein
MPSRPINGTITDGTVVIAPHVEVYVEYTDVGRNDRTDTLAIDGEIIDPTHWRVVIDFGDRVQGGTLYVNLRVVAVNPNGQEVELVASDSSVVTGINPTKAEVKARLAELRFQVLAYKESRFQQFNAQGMPKANKVSKDFGIMQLHQTTNTPTARQIWDWKQNVDAGVALFRSKEPIVRQHFKNIRDEYPDAPELTADQLKLAYYQYYNGGFYWKWNNVAKAWQKMSAAATKYADDCLRVENLVRAGTPPADWD